MFERPRQQICPRCHGAGFVTPSFDSKALLEALALYVGTATVNTSTLLKLARNAPLLQLAIAGLDARRLGIVLHRVSIESDIGGLRLEHQGRDKNGSLWRVRFPEVV
jgi:hypothetical protein